MVQVPFLSITKKDMQLHVFFIMVREAGLEPARPEWTLEPESSESANSTTRAFVQSLDCSNILAQLSRIVNNYFRRFLILFV